MIKRLFNAENPFWLLMGTVFDLFILNTLWLLCCIPIVTIGPSTTAAFYSLIQRARGEESEIHKDFFRSFRQNLKQGMIIGIILTLIGVFLVIDIWLCRNAGKGIFTFFLFFFAVIFIFWAMTTLYTFPVLSKFDRKTKDIFIWAFTLSIKNILSTLTMLFVIAAGIWICRILPGLIFIMFGLTAQYCAVVFAGIFKPFLPKPWRNDENDDTGFSAGNSGYPAGKESGSDEYNDVDTTYSDFDEAAFYGYDPEEVKKLSEEGKNDEE